MKNIKLFWKSLLLWNAWNPFLRLKPCPIIVDWKTAKMVAKIIVEWEK